MKTIVVVAVILLLFFGFRHFVLAANFPQTSESLYFLPWKAGDTYYCFQGVNGFLGYRGRIFYSWDFLMWTGTPLLASRDGKVSLSVDDNEGRGSDVPNNEIYIDHGDG